MTPKIISVASSKGGVGKSTVALGLARALASAGCKTLLADLDFGNACLDILGGVEDSVLYTVNDALSGICTPEAAVVKMPEDGLYLIPAPSVKRRQNIGSENGSLSDVLERAAAAVGTSYLIIDTGAGVNETAEEAFAFSDTVLVVANHSPVSVRAAENTAMRIRSCGAEDIKLIINSFDTENILKEKKNSRASMLDITDGCGVQLIGVVPYDYSLELSGEKPGAKCSDNSASAFRNIALRLDGHSVPLFSGMKKIRRKRKFLFS